MYGPRSIQAPLGQKAPVLSELNDCATSGALPPRIAATILSSFVPPITFTWIPACVASKSFTTAFSVSSSGSTKGVHMVMFAGSTLVVPVEVSDEDFFEPPQALTPSVSASTSVSVSARLIPSSSDLVRVLHAIFSQPGFRSQASRNRGAVSLGLLP